MRSEFAGLFLKLNKVASRCKRRALSPHFAELLADYGAKLPNKKRVGLVLKFCLLRRRWTMTKTTAATMTESAAMRSVQTLRL
ncbi:MAG: hypothetical protein LH479_10435 [Polaromonas sp.]|nr:hypothetical protein [Polaromonas sp.]